MHIAYPTNNFKDLLGNATVYLAGGDAAWRHRVGYLLKDIDDLLVFFAGSFPKPNGGCSDTDEVVDWHVAAMNASDYALVRLDEGRTASKMALMALPLAHGNTMVVGGGDAILAFCARHTVPHASSVEDGTAWLMEKTARLRRHR